MHIAECAGSCVLPGAAAHLRVSMTGTAGSAPLPPLHVLLLKCTVIYFVFHAPERLHAIVRFVLASTTGSNR